jgi:hypothetical protein
MSYRYEIWCLREEFLCTVHQIELIHKHDFGNIKLELDVEKEMLETVYQNVSLSFSFYCVS